MRLSCSLPIAHLAAITCLVLIPTERAASVVAAQPSSALDRIQLLVDELGGELQIEARISARIVAQNPLLVSAEASADVAGSFVIAFEDGFAETLPTDELRAVIAHELGHVWIFTHHPFLQTERLANDVARRVVSRDSLERVYAKVWTRVGVKGDLARFLGQ